MACSATCAAKTQPILQSAPMRMKHVCPCAHLDEQRQRPALHNLPLVVIILEGQRAQGACCCTLHLQVPAVQKPHQRSNAAIRPHLQDTSGFACDCGHALLCLDAGATFLLHVVCRPVQSRTQAGAASGACRPWCAFMQPAACQHSAADALATPGFTPKAATHSTCPAQAAGLKHVPRIDVQETAHHILDLNVFMRQVGDCICCSPRHAPAAAACLRCRRPFARAGRGARWRAADAVRCKKLHQTCSTTPAA